MARQGRRDSGRPRTDPGWEVTLALRGVQRASGQARQGMARRLGMGVTDVDALDHLGAAGARLGPAELGQRLGIRSASATALVDRLEQAGHVVRERDPLDRRRQRLALTDHAHDEAWGALQPLLSALTGIANDLTPAERRTVQDYLERAAAVLTGYASDGDRPPGE